MITYKDLKEKTKKIERKYNLTHYELLQRFMFERLLERISLSPYNKNFILKGGLLLSSLFGVENRTTKDMDTTLKGLDISKEKMMDVFNHVLSIDLKDGVKFNVVEITDIREDDKYGGNKYHIVAKLENLKINLEIDVSTGDEVTPKELNYMYASLFENKSFQIYSYNLETILAEKIETILHRGLYNNRMKDYYDVYIILSRLNTEIDVEILKKAMLTTFKKRNTVDKLIDYKQILNEIYTYGRLNDLWVKYAKKNPYAKNFQFPTIVLILIEFLDELNFDVKSEHLD